MTDVYDPRMSPAADPNDDFIDDLSDLLAEAAADPERAARAQAAMDTIEAGQAQHHLGLQQLRASFGLTQTELASWLGVNQANVAQAEKRTDMLVSTLRRYVEGITGGQLEFRITFPDRPSMRFDINEIEGTKPEKDAAQLAA